MQDTQTMTGTLTLTLHDPAGRVVDRREVHNLVTDAGRTLVAELFAGKRLGAVAMRLVVGVDTKAASVADTALGREVAAVGLSQSDIQVSGARTTLTGRLPESEAAQPLTEAGISIVIGTAPAVLYNRVVFAVVNKGPNMQMTLTWCVDFGGGK